MRKKFDIWINNSVYDNACSKINILLLWTEICITCTGTVTCTTTIYWINLTLSDLTTQYMTMRKKFDIWIKYAVYDNARIKINILLLWIEFCITCTTTTYL